MSFIQEFKAFALRGNMVDLAIGVIIGAAFGKIVSSLVGDVLMPPIGALLGGVDFSSLSLTVKQASAGGPAIVIKYGSFINTLIDFSIIAFVIFLVIKLMNRLQPPKAATVCPCPECLMEIPVKAKRCGHCTSQVKL